MRKTLCIIVLFISQNIFSQEYFFDYYYEYESEKSVCFILINSKDSNYAFFGHYGTETNNNYDSTGASEYIVDFPRDVIHFYELENIENDVKFNYLRTKKYHELIGEFEKKNQYENIITKIDSVKESVKFIKYKQKNKRKNLAEIELLYDKNNINYIFHNSALIFFLHHFFDNRNIENANNRLPSSISMDYYDGFKSYYKLNKIKKINSSLNIKREEIKYMQ